ncbi:MAG: hypothetical protein LBS20_15480 [Prevotella sp.]|nr:hypothetical protein [Prevotella sp.]
MKRFILEELFPALRNASQTGTDVQREILDSAYEKFAGRLLTEDIACTDRKTYRQVLVYTRAELAGLTGVPGKM